MRKNGLKESGTDPKEYLSQARYLDMRIRSKIRQINAMNDIETSCAVDITEDMNKIKELKEELCNNLSYLIALKEEITGVIQSVENPEYQTLLEKRYLCSQSWEKIAVDMDYDLRYIHKLHNRALEKCRFLKEDTKRH